MSSHEEVFQTVYRKVVLLGHAPRNCLEQRTSHSKSMSSEQHTSPQANASLSELLHLTPVRLVVQHKKALVQLYETDTVQMALHMMDKYKILSLPIWAYPGRWIAAGGVTAVSQDHRQYIGIISILDIAMWITSLDKHDSDSLRKMLSETRITDLIGTTLEGQSLWTFDDSSSVQSVMRVLSHGVHRALVAVHEHAGKLTEAEMRFRESHKNASKDLLSSTDVNYRLATQTDLIRYLLHHIEKSKFSASFLNQTVEELGLFGTTEGALNSALRPSHLIFAKLKTPVTEALRRMKDAMVQAVAVVDSSGRFVSTFSASDLRHILGEIHTLNGWTVEQLLQQVYGPNRDDWPFPVTCTREAKLGHVMTSIVEKKVHRCWVLDHEGHPIQVITMTDIIRLWC